MVVCDKRDLDYYWGDVGMYIYESVSLHSPSLKKKRERDSTISSNSNKFICNINNLSMDGVLKPWEIFENPGKATVQWLANHHSLQSTGQGLHSLQHLFVVAIHHHWVQIQPSGQGIGSPTCIFTCPGFC